MIRETNYLKQKIVLKPVTRIRGFMEIDAIIENNRVIDAKAKGLLFKGFDKMLYGRNPFDAKYITQRICGIYSTAHSVASSLALEDAMGVIPSEQGKYFRDILHGCEFLRNHIRHFYQYTLPDFVKLSEDYSLILNDHDDYRLPKVKSENLRAHYSESLHISQSTHEMSTVLGGKAPYNNGNYIGGFAGLITTDKILRMKEILHKVRQFISDKMVSDAFTIARYYSDYYSIGKGYGNFLSYGCFNGYKDIGTLYVNPRVYIKGKENVFDPGKIKEEIDYSWYIYKNNSYKPLDAAFEEDMNMSNIYSWVKAPRYNGLTCEVGPLARQWLCGDYRNGISTMDRIIARVLEAKKIAEIIGVLLENLTAGAYLQHIYTIPESIEGTGLVDTSRGALGHWLKIDNGILSSYRIITPSSWNLSTRGNNNLRGAAEQALIGTNVQNADNPIELGRIIRSFDPCVSCETHLYSREEHIKTIQVVP